MTLMCSSPKHSLVETKNPRKMQLLLCIDASMQPARTAEVAGSSRTGFNFCSAGDSLGQQPRTPAVGAAVTSLAARQINNLTSVAQGGSEGAIR